MIPSRYILIDERSPYPVKRRVRGRRDEKHEPAITLLPPDPYLIMEKPNFDRLPSPTMYRTAPPKSAKNKEASSFVILGETLNTPVQSRPSSPSGRVSPFRGHGFKSPNATRPNSRAASPSNSPRKNLPKSITDKPRISKDIGLPPKSPKSKKPKLLAVAKSEKKETTEEHVIKTEDAELPKASLEESEIEKKQEEAPKLESPKKEMKPEQKDKPKLTLPQSKKPPVSPTPRNKQRPENMEEKFVSKKATKPPVPPKKVGVKATLKMVDVTKQSDLGKVKEAIQPVKEKETVQPTKTAVETAQAKENGEKEEKNEKKKQKEVRKEEGKEEKNKEVRKEEKKEEKKKEIRKEEGKEKELSKEEAKGEKEVRKEEEKEEEEEEEKRRRQEEKKEQKLIPCFQPDKCHIAPPTMASPSPIITPSISTPSTTADLASSSTKNSQSISAAPTTVTPSSFSSVSSTVVLSGNLARKEIEHRAKGTEAKLESRASVAPAKDPEPPPAPKASVQMLKTQSKDSISWSKKDNLSGEITSTTKVIKAEPDMEVLSPNNLRDSPPRAPPPNMAWEDERLPNGDVPNKAETEGKFRRFISAAWEFLSYLICCRCFKRSNCCRRQHPEDRPPAPPKPSLFTKLNCFKGRSCSNPFKSCLDCCRSKCCDKFKCCRGKPKPKSKPRKCCAKSKCCSLKGCCDRLKHRCSDCRDKVNSCCRSLFCLNLMCCQRFLKKFKFCHKFKCCQKDGFCSCCNPNVKETRKLNKKGSRGSNNSKDKDNLDVVLVEHTSLMKAAIPVLPSCLAIFCLICNLFIPGFGTLISGMLCLCFGKPRFSAKDTPKSRFGSFIVNTIIAVAQLFTVVFCLVGWGWSIWWGVIMYKLSRRQKRLKLAEKNQKEAEGSNVNHNHVDIEQG